jgi:two-component system, LuxR family, response regulator FixJ
VDLQAWQLTIELKEKTVLICGFHAVLSLFIMSVKTLFSTTHTNLTRVAMNALVLDRQNDARKLWQTVLGEFGICSDFPDSVTSDLLKPRLKPRIFVLDLSMVGNCLDRAVDVCKQLSLDAVVITGADISVAASVRLMKHGAAWAFRKDHELNPQQIREAIPMIQEGLSNLADQIIELRRLQDLLSNISPRERSVLDMVLDGIPNKQIAKQLEVSVRTVESRRAKIYRKCEVSNVTELVRRVDRAQQLRGRYGDCLRDIRENERCQQLASN